MLVAFLGFAIFLGRISGGFRGALLEDCWGGFRFCFKQFWKTFWEVVYRICGGFFVRRNLFSQVFSIALRSLSSLLGDFFQEF